MIVGTVQALLAARELPRLDSENEIPWWWKFRDILACLSQWAVMLAILTLHTYLTFFITVPGKSKGVFTCSILASIVTILVSIVAILASIDPILEKCVHLQVQYSQVLSQYL